MARPGLTNHRKFRRLAKQLGSAVVARGVLELIWESCYESGDEYVGTAEDIDHLIGWTGDPGIVALALVAAGLPEGHGFLEPAAEDVGGPMRYRVHDLWHHAPDYVTKRHKREMERRQRTDPVSAERRRTAPTLDSQAGDVLPPSPAPAPSPAPVAKNVSAEPLRDSTPAVSVVLVYPTVGRGAESWALTDAQIAEWQTCYPGVDVGSECRQALAWLRANPARRKTARGMPAFLVGWLNRSTDRGGRAPAGAGHAEPKPDREIWVCRHVEECSHRAMCEHKNNMPHKYPRRREAEAS